MKNSLFILPVVMYSPMSEGFGGGFREGARDQAPGGGTGCLEGYHDVTCGDGGTACIEGFGNGTSLEGYGG